MHMKKRIIIISSGLFILVVIAFAITNIVGKNDKKLAGKDQPAEDYGIDYFEVPDFEQVYINGVIQPDQMEAFAKDQKMTSDPEIKVENGAIVDAGTELYVYEDKEVTKEIEMQNNTLSKLYTQRENVLAKWNRSIANFNNTAEEQRSTTKAQLDEQYQGEIDTVDEEIYFTNATISDLSTKQYISVTAKFTGRVSIPEVKDEEAPVLRLTSEGLYMAGEVNEKDLPKISLDQSAVITVISNNQTFSGKISYIDDNPPEKSGQDPDSNNSMSTYTVKLSLDSLENIKNGYHVQGTINMNENAPIEIPTKAIRVENDVKYVLVNDFGSVIRRVIQVGDENGENTQVQSGLEAADQIIVSSKKEVKEGDLIQEEDSENNDDHA